MSWGEIGLLASILGVFVTIGSVVQGMISSRTMKAMHGETQTTLRALGEGQSKLGEILAQMETNAEDRYRDLKDRLGGGAEA